jgi:hypothetical protein
MDKKTLAALKRSIEKWKGNAAGKHVKTRSDDCPLCGLFIDNDCNGCPVMVQTGKEFCCDTPYFAATSALSRGDNNMFTEQSFAEVVFLESLLPEGEK